MRPAVHCRCSVIVVPVVLFLSVLLLQLLASALRRPLLRLVDRLCAKSEFFMHHLGGMLAAPSSVTAHAAGQDEERPEELAGNSASTSGNRGSVGNVHVFGDQVTGAGSS